LTSSSAISSSLTAAFVDFLFSDFALDAFAESLPFFSAVPGAFGVVSFNFWVVLGVLEG